MSVVINHILYFLAVASEEVISQEICQRVRELIDLVSAILRKVDFFELLF